MSTDTLQAELDSPAVQIASQAHGSMRLGSFAVTGTLPATEGSSMFSVVGAEDSAFAGQAGIATTVTVSEAAEEIARTAVLLAKLRHLTHPALAPVLEAGSTGSIAHWVYALPGGQPLASAFATAMPIVDVVAMVERIGGALQIAHDLGLSHGSISRNSIYLAANGQAVLTGIGMAGRGFAADQRDLATVAVDLLGGRAWAEPMLSAEPSSARSRALREFLSDYTERVANVLTRATNPDAAEQFDSISEFARSFADAVRLSAEDLVHGAYEAISARSPDLAKVIADKAATYDPACESLALLNLQLRGDSPFGKAPLPPALDDAAPMIAPPPKSIAPPALTFNGSGDLADVARSHLPEELTRDLPEEFLRAIAPQFTYTPTKSRVNPIFVLILGAVGIAVLLAAAGLGTVLLSGR